MIKYEGRILLDVVEASQTLNKSIAGFNQFIRRGRISKVKIGSRNYFDQAEVYRYYTDVTGLPQYEESEFFKTNKEVLTLKKVREILPYSLQHINNLVKKGKFRLFVTYGGMKVIPREDIDLFLGVTHNDAKDL